MPPLARRALARALFLLALIVAPGSAMAQFGVPAPSTPAPCPAFTGFPMALNLGSISLGGNDGVTNRCAFQTTQAALNALSTQTGLLAPLANPTFTGNVTVQGSILCALNATCDVSALSALGSGESAIRLFSSRLTDIPISIESFRGGACAGATDATCATQAAINAATALNREVLLPGGVTVVGGLTFSSKVTIRGRGEGVSTLQLKNGANNTLLASAGAYSLFGTNSQAGVIDFTIADLTLDGNRANNTVGDCLAIYGSRFRLRNLTLRNCPDMGMHTGWGPYGDGPMEASFNNILVDTAGTTGVSMEGPHDSLVYNMIVVDAGQKADNTYAQIYMGSNMTGRFSGLHTWHRSTVTNRTSIGLNDAFGAGDFSNSHFEGSNNAAAQIAGTNSTYSDSVVFYSPWKTGSSSVVVTGSNNQIRGSILGSIYVPGQPPRTGIYMGPSASGNLITMKVFGSTTAALDVTAGDAGYNQFNLSGAQSTGPGVIGALSDQSSANINMAGATSTGRILKDAAIAPPATSSAPCTYGQRAFDTQYEYRCTAANTWKRSTLSTF